MTNETPPDSPRPKRSASILKKLALLALVAAAVLLVRVLGLDAYLSLEAIKTSREALLVLVSENYVLAAAGFVTVYVVVTGLSLPGATVLTLLSGFLFGTMAAIILVNIGATLGATGAFLMTRYVLGQGLQERFGEKLEKLNRELARNGGNYLLTLRLIPLFPFFLVNIAAGLTKIPLSTYLWTTALGILPADAAYSFAGSQLGKISSLDDIVSPGLLGAFAALGCLSLIPVFYRRFRATKG